jgi:hypothetical protein
MLWGANRAMAAKAATSGFPITLHDIRMSVWRGLRWSCMSFVRTAVIFGRQRRDSALETGASVIEPATLSVEEWSQD